MKLSRRNLIVGISASLIAAPAIVRAGSLMPVKAAPLQGHMGRFLGFDIMIDFDAAAAEMARIMRVPECWMTDKGLRALGQESP